MSVMDEIKKLEAQKQKLLTAAKEEALAKASQAVKDLAELGYNYKLVQDGSASQTTGTRRSGIREAVIATIQKEPNGIAKKGILEALGAKGNKSYEDSISNALTGLKKAGTIKQDGTLYKAP